ncbi:hypothetical protein RhiirA1_458760 [Rhizophagus irregularis]|uniref:Uncharacterized protein n=1 Tax=Rhizophagus irregularis TaxID=588596 RepID=A0A2N0RV28_9GLOM|nr:hypothetical protein RhiirA1_458760 [Rhizophagus irregularis]
METNFSRTWKWRLISVRNSKMGAACNSKMKTDFSLKLGNGDRGIFLKGKVILAQNSIIETGDLI